MKALVLAAVLAVGIPYPTIPEGATPVGEVEVGMCPDGGVWRLGYNLAGDPNDPEIMVVGRVGLKEPMVWVFFKTDGNAERVVLTLPGRAPEEVSYEELIRRYPSPCALPVLKDV